MILTWLKPERTEPMLFFSCFHFLGNKASFFTFSKRMTINCLHFKAIKLQLKNVANTFSLLILQDVQDKGNVWGDADSVEAGNFRNIVVHVLSFWYLQCALSLLDFQTHSIRIRVIMGMKLMRRLARVTKAIKNMF